MFQSLYVLVLVCMGLGLNHAAWPWEKFHQKSDTDRVPGQYIVVLQPGFQVDAFLDKYEVANSGMFANCSILSLYRNVLNGFSAKLTITSLQKLLELDEVSHIEENGVMRALQGPPGSWGIDRVDQRYLPLDGQADFSGDGSGVNVYILDTGIYPSNTYFRGRATVAYDAVGGPEEGVDCNGHGTHCAGTVGANSFGIARGANLLGVRVLNCFGMGTNAQVIDGLEWVQQNGEKPAVASMSLGGGPSETLDEAVTSLINSGISVSVAAGNDDADACAGSPSRVPIAFTVAATDIEDNRAYFSSYGTCVDIFAPGVDITSTWFTGPDATNTISGTSMACPHVTGAIAIALGNDESLIPAEIKRKIVDDGTSDVVIDPQTGSPNLLLYIP